MPQGTTDLGEQRGGGLANGNRDDRCHTSMLSARAEDPPPSGGAGTAYGNVVLTNTSGVRCTIYGFGGLGLIGKHGENLPTKLQRDTSDPEMSAPRLVTLAPGDSAKKRIKWSTVPSGPADCSAEQDTDEPARIKVTPPDEQDPLTVDWLKTPVCDYGTITGGAFV